MFCMPLTTTPRTKLVDQVIDQIRQLVGSGEWPVGQRIPNEGELVKSLGVGRNTVREAVRALAHSGILEVRQGDGTYVRATSEVSGALRRLCGSELRDILQVRRALEVEGARLAAANRTAEDVSRMEELLSRRDESVGVGETAEFAMVDTEFHLAVVSSSHNEMLTALYRGLVEAITASVAATSTLHVDVDDDHRDLLAHVTAGEPEEAARVVGAMLDRVLATVSVEPQ
jgi:DNA-binding FadR family transcriptional regulator